MNSVIWDRELYLRTAHFACEAHAHQQVKDSSANYALHLALVCMEVMSVWHLKNDFDIDLALTCAWLHDTLEDTNTTPHQIRELFGPQVLFCVEALTKDTNVAIEDRMSDVIHRLHKAPREASIVKLADRIVNMQEPPHSWNIEKRREYRNEALLILEGLKKANSILYDRLKQKINDYSPYI